MVVVDKMGTAAPNEPLRFSPLSFCLSVCLLVSVCLSLPPPPPCGPRMCGPFAALSEACFLVQAPAPSLLWGAGSTPARPPPIGDPSSSDLHPACCSLNFFFVPLLILICFAAWALFNGGWSFTNLLILSLDPSFLLCCRGGPGHGGPMLGARGEALSSAIARPCRFQAQGHLPSPGSSSPSLRVVIKR